MYSQQNEKPTEVDFYILAGQSNMQGSGNLKQVGEKFAKPLKGVFIWNQKAQKFEVFKGAGRFGPELGFAHRLRELQPKGDIYLLKLGLSGQPLHHGMDNQSWLNNEFAPKRRNFYPGKNRKDPNQGLHYINLMKRYDAAVKSLTDTKVRLALKGIVWMQGEADAKHKPSGSSYGESLARFKKRVEEDTSSGVVPFVFGKVLPGDVVPAKFKAYKELHQQMKQVDMDSGHKDSVLGMRLVGAPKDMMKKDNVHYTSDGYITIGTDFANAMKAVQKVLPVRLKSSTKEKQSK